MQKIMKLPCSVAILGLFILSACGGGGGSESASPPNAAPVLTVTSSTLSLESGSVTQVEVTATDDDGAPILSVSSFSPNLTVELSGNGKTLTITAKAVSVKEQGTVTLTAVENNTAKKQTVRQIAVDVFPKLNLFAFANGKREESTISVAYPNPLSIRVVDENNTDIPFSNAIAKDPSIIKVEQAGSSLIVSVIKTGSTTIEVSGIAGSGLQYKKSIAVNATGNQKPSLNLTPSTLTVEESDSLTIETSIVDPDGSWFKLGTMNASSANNTIATATVKDGKIQLTAMKVGSTTVSASLVDGEFTVNASVAVTVIPETLPVIAINNDSNFELEEYDEITIPIEIKGNKASNYQPAVVFEKNTQDAPDINYSVIGNSLTIKAPALKSGQSSAHYSVKASATNGKQTISAKNVSLMVTGRMNSAPIFELPNVVDSAVMIPKTGGIIKIIVNDDDASRVLISQKEWINNSKAGTYTASYEDTTRTLLMEMNGFEVNEEFGVLMPYTDGALKGSFSILFRTYELSPTDIEVLEMRKDAIARNEAARAYRLIAKLYAEHLENIGLADAQYVDELFDELQSDDVNSYHGWLESFIENILKDVYRGNYNNGKANAAETKLVLENYYKQAAELNKGAINTINDLAKKSNGKFPTLIFESNMQKVESLHYSKFYNNPTYGSIVDGQWHYALPFEFLSAIDAKVKENTANRIR